MTDPSGGLYAPSLVEVTTRQLREEILSGQLVPGERLIEEQIRLRFSISRAPLREALRSLAQQGLVEHLPRRGMRVTDLTASDVDQLFGIRRVLERHAIETTFPMDSRPDRERLADVHHWLDRMRRADAEDDQLLKDDAHRALHAAIVGLADNRQLDLALEPILLKLQRPMALNLRREAQVFGPAAGLQRHERLVAALQTNDLEMILTELESHGVTRFLTTSRTWPADSPALAEA